MMKILPAG